MLDWAHDGNTHVVTIGGLSGRGVTVTFSITYNGSTTAPTNAGTYAVVVTFSNGATIFYTVPAMTINQK